MVQVGNNEASLRLGKFEVAAYGHMQQFPTGPGGSLSLKAMMRDSVFL